MRAEWEECPRGDIGAQYAGIYVTMNTSGVIALGRVAHEMLGAPRALLLLFDRTNRRIGLKPTATGIRNAYPVLVSNSAGGKKINAFRLIREYRIDLPQTVRFYDAEIDDDGILRLDLRTAKLCPRAASHWRKRDKDQKTPAVTCQ